ncbi:hypothetical protein EK0264_08140 [Epidermidibacterium keratini]|uniref:Uncharacterized protein n=1 Tax=Epidermidibacterium keratini TaxID=1891644 RepID=A0A7L4YM86_9ACTN|nr:hypothetical protein [Epidermidibacterium keratini]QHC00250.1 hypothetical protein EK0264_08140 [Epidermidibacterium keratini]
MKAALRNLGFILLGVFLYFVSIEMFSGYPSWNSEFWNRLAIAALVVIGAIVWWWHEHHGESLTDDDPNDRPRVDESDDGAR